MSVVFEGTEYLIGRSDNLVHMPLDWREAGSVDAYPSHPQAKVYRCHGGGLMLVWQPINSQWRRFASMRTKAQILEGWT